MQIPPQDNIPFVAYSFSFPQKNQDLPFLWNSEHRQCAPFISGRALMYASEDCHKVLSVFTFLFFVFGVYSSIHSWCLCCFCMSCGFQVLKQFISRWKCTVAGYTMDGNFMLQRRKKPKYLTFIRNM